MRDQPEKQEKQEKAQEPELLEHSYMEEEGDSATRPPYIFLALIAFVLFSFIWKGFMSSGSRDEEKDVLPISKSQVAEHEDMMK